MTVLVGLRQRIRIISTTEYMRKTEETILILFISSALLIFYFEGNPVIEYANTLYRRELF